MKEKNIIIDNDEETDIEEADASEKEFLSLVKGSGSIKLKKCKITTKMFE
ncbi:MAG: hypothetical protein HUJ42_03500, partial [Malacoplasma sp.]|nr:hypothetical protein [Malacoplasma sp.]